MQHQRIYLPSVIQLVKKYCHNFSTHFQSKRITFYHQLCSVSCNPFILEGKMQLVKAFLKDLPSCTGACACPKHGRNISLATTFQWLLEIFSIKFKTLPLNPCHRHISLSPIFPSFHPSLSYPYGISLSYMLFPQLVMLTWEFGPKISVLLCTKHTTLCHHALQKDSKSSKKNVFCQKEDLD